MFEGQPTDFRLGALWRDVLNFLGDRPVTPDEYLPLADAVLPRWAQWPGYVGGAADFLAANRAEVEADVARARIGWTLWVERREDLRAYAEKAAGSPVGDSLLRRWWVLHEHGEMAGWDLSHHDVGITRSAKLQRLLRITDEEDRILRYQPRRNGEHYSDRWNVSSLHSHLSWAEDLETLRQLARKTWPADRRDRLGWTPEELEWVNGFFEDQQPFLVPPTESPSSIDPFELKILNDEQHIGFGLSDLSAIELVFMRATVVDFAESVLEHIKRPNSRGSLSCVECGRFVGRRALGYGQLYCSDRCKKRAAKRRYRARVATVAQVAARQGLGELDPLHPPVLERAGTRP
jgi:hypothetical protein